MEIRRKVFSLLEDENGEERLYSTTEFEIEFDEETGEKMFSEKEGMSKGKKAALIGTGAAVATVGGLELANILKKRHLTKAELEELKKLKETVGLGKEDLKAYVKDYRAGHKGIGFVEKGNKWVAKTGKKALEAGKSGFEKGKEKIKSALKKEGKK